MIKLQVIGNLGKDAVVNTVNNKTVINFNVAHTERFKDSQGVQKDRTIWVECAYWTDRTAIAPYLKKGTSVYAEGSPDIRTYSTQDGKQGVSLTLRISNVQLLGNKSENSGQPASNGNYNSSYQQPVQQPSYQQQPATTAHATVASELTEPLDDLPF